MKTNEEDAFTRVDLLAVIVIIGLLAVLALPAIGGIARDANTDLCQNNQRQLMRAMHLYAADNGDYFPIHNDDGASSPGSEWLAHIVTSLPNATNSAKLIDPAYSMLANYLPPDPSVFKCPADTSTVSAGGVPVPRVRSISLSQAVGTDRRSPGAKGPAIGAWLDGAHNHFANTIWRCYARLADVVNPRPAQLWVFVDEHPNSINDAGYGGIGPGDKAFARWVDYPATYHNNGAGFVFADGHAETKLWTAPPSATLTAIPPSPASLADLNWVANRTSALVADQP